MILDEVLPRFDYRESYSIFVAGTSRERAYEVVRRFDFGGSLVVRLLLRLRGMSANSLSLDGLIRAGFIPLEAL